MSTVASIFLVHHVDSRWQGCFHLLIEQRVMGRELHVVSHPSIGRVIAIPLHEEFVDGPVWDNPHPPRAGDPRQPLL